MKKLLYFTLAAFTLIFTSCGMNKNNISEGYLKSERLETSQQLTIQPSNHEKLAPINIQVCGDIAQTNSCDIQGNTTKFQDQSLKASAKKPAYAPTLVRKAGKKLLAITKLPNAIGAVSQIMKMPKHVTSIKRSQFSDSALLLLWIITLVAAVIFFFLINVFGEVTTLGILFNILAILALVAFIIFFLLWITQLYKEKHHII